MAASRRNYAAMKDSKLQLVAQELIDGGDAHARCVNSGGDPQEDFARVRTLLEDRGLPVPGAAAVAGEPAVAAPGAPKMVGAHKPAAAEVDTVPYGWHIEPKVDGWWVQAYVHGREDAEVSDVVMWTRNGDVDVSPRLPHIAYALATGFPVGTRVVGEIVHREYGGSQIVHSLMRRTSKDPTGEGTLPLQFVIFDALEWAGEDLKSRPFSARRDALARLLDDADRAWAFSFGDGGHVKHIPSLQAGEAEAAFDEAIALGYEGVVAKDRNAPYLPGTRGHGLLKVKLKDTVDVIVMRVNPGSGEYAAQGLSGGFDFGQHRAQSPDIIASGASLQKRGSCSSGLTFEQRRDMLENPERWIGQVVELGHMGVQAGGFRHPRFIRIRDDKPAEEVTWHDK